MNSSEYTDTESSEYKRITSLKYNSDIPEYVDVKIEDVSIPIIILSTKILSERVLLYRIDTEYKVTSIVGRIISAIKDKIQVERVTMSLNLNLLNDTFKMDPNMPCATFNNKSKLCENSTIGEVYYMRQGDHMISWNRGSCKTDLTMRIRFIRYDNGIHSYGQVLLSSNIVHDTSVSLTRYTIRY